MNTTEQLKAVDRRTLKVSDVKQYVTENYDLFNLSPFNRKPTLSKKLLDSIRKNDWTKYNPILVDKHMTIVDGQHRFVVCVDLGLPIHFIIAEDIIINDAADINQATKNWSTLDFIEHFQKRGVPAYKKLVLLAKQYQHPTTNLLALGKASTDKTETITDLIKAGKFEFRMSDARVRELLDNFEIFQKYYDEFYKTTVFFKAYVRIATLADYNHSNTVAKLKVASGYVHQQPTQTLMIESLLKMYNFKMKRKLKLDKQPKTAAVKESIAD